jgi:hypothetical protein
MTLLRTHPRARVCYYWNGSDVLHTLEEARAGTLRRSAFEAARRDLHLAHGTWLAEELAEVGIVAAVSHKPSGYTPPTAPPAYPSQFRALTYVPIRRLEFYRGDVILDVARLLPDVPFDIAGRGSEGITSDAANVRCHGWVADMASLYGSAAVVIRIPLHDGLSNTVVEGLFNARHVIYTYDVPHVISVSPLTADALAARIADLHAAHEAGRLGPNLAGRAYAESRFDEGRRTDELVAQLSAHFGT